MGKRRRGRPPGFTLVELLVVIAIIALLIAILPNLPGFLVNVKLLDAANTPRFFIALYDYAWFVGFAIAFVVYLALRFASSKNENARSATV